MRNKLFTIGLPFVMVACIFIGCATMGGDSDGSEPGTLTITGIPAQYNGKFVLFSWLSDIKTSAVKPVGSSPTLKGTVITNGAVTLPLYKGNSSLFSGIPAYNGSDTLNIELVITDKDTPSQNAPDAYFTSVVFENGVAEVQWDTAVIPSTITITNIPADLNNMEIEILIGASGTALRGYTGEFTIFRMKPTNGTLTAKIFSRNKQGPICIPVTESSTKDIALAITDPNSGVQRSRYVLFKNAQITNGKVTLDFRQGSNP